MQPIKTSIQSAIHTLSIHYPLFTIFTLSTLSTFYTLSTFSTHLHNSTHRHPLIPLYSLYFLYPLYPLYPSPSTHPIPPNSVSSITLTAYTHYGSVLQRYEHRNSHFTVLCRFVSFCPLFICKKLSYNRCFFRLRVATAPTDVCCLGAALTLSIKPQKFRDSIFPA